MKSNIKVIILLLCVLYPIICNSQEQTGCEHTSRLTQGSDVNCNYDPYMLIFEDNFDGNSLDLNKWFISTGVTRDFPFDNEKEWRTANNIVVENGVLKIITKREYMNNMTYYDYDANAMTTQDFEFTTGEINTISAFPINGKFEARIKLPYTYGLWPAFWLYNEIGDSYNEIDIFEVYNNWSDWRYNTNLYYSSTGGYNATYKCLKRHGFDLIFFGFVPLIFNDFNTYTLIWDEDKIEWYINGYLIRKEPFYFTRVFWGAFGVSEHYCGDIKKGEKYRRNKFFPQYPMHIVLNTAVRSPETKENPDASVPFPAQMEVDYVRVYQRKPCNSDVTVSNNPITNDYKLTGEVLSKLITGKNVNLDCNIKIGSQHEMRVVAKNTVNFEENFSIDVENGGSFIAETKSNLCNSLKRIFIQNITPYDYVVAEDSIYDDDTTVVYDNVKELYGGVQPLFIYPTLDDSSYIIIDFRDNEYKDISLSIINDKNDIMYFNNSIEEKISYIDLSSYELENYALQLINRLTKREEIYNIEIIE